MQGTFSLESHYESGAARSIAYQSSPDTTEAQSNASHTEAPSKSEFPKLYILKYGDLITKDTPEGKCILTPWHTGQSVVRYPNSSALSIAPHISYTPRDIRFNPMLVKDTPWNTPVYSKSTLEGRRGYREILDQLVGHGIPLDAALCTQMPRDTVWVLIWDSLDAHYSAHTYWLSAFLSGILHPCGHSAIAIKYGADTYDVDTYPERRFEYIRLCKTSGSSCLDSALFVPAYLPHQCFEDISDENNRKLRNFAWFPDAELSISKRHADYCIELKMEPAEIRALLERYDGYRSPSEQKIFSGFWSRLCRFFIERNTSTFNHYLLSAASYESLIQDSGWPFWVYWSGQLAWNGAPLLLSIFLGFLFYDTAFDDHKLPDGSSHPREAALRTLTVAFFLCAWEFAKLYAKSSYFIIRPSAFHDDLLEASKRHGKDRTNSKVYMASTSYIFDHSTYPQHITQNTSPTFRAKDVVSHFRYSLNRDTGTESPIHRIGV